VKISQKVPFRNLSRKGIYYINLYLLKGSLSKKFDINILTLSQWLGRQDFGVFYREFKASNTGFNSSHSFCGYTLNTCLLSVNMQYFSLNLKYRPPSYSLGILRSKLFTQLWPLYIFQGSIPIREHSVSYEFLNRQTAERLNDH
jgi:hypothetical protein